MAYMLVTLLTSHAFNAWLKAPAFTNMERMFVTLLTSQDEILPLKEEAP